MSAATCAGRSQLDASPGSGWVSAYASAQQHVHQRATLSVESERSTCFVPLRSDDRVGPQAVT
jgi:hypothetical protein